MNLLLRQVTVCDIQSDFHKKKVDILIKNGKIEAIAKKLNSDAKKIVEGENLFVSRGWIDILADYCEPGYEHKETISSGLKCAAAGGYTKVMVAPNTKPSLSNKSAIQYVLQRAENKVVQLMPLGSISQNIEGKELAEMMDMHAFGAIAFTDGWKPLQSAGLMLKALEYVKAFDGVLMQLPIDNTLSAGGLMHEGITSTRLGISGIPDLAETVLLHRDIELLRYTQSRLHVTGISAAASVALIRKAKTEGLNITCSVTPYHLALNDEALKTYNSLYKVMPPLRTEEDRLALIEGLKDGTIDCIASHHRPQDWDAKTKEFEYAADGMNLQQNAVQIAYEAVKGKISLEQLINAINIKPCEIFNLQTEKIAEGSNAELTIFSTGGQKNIKSNSLSANNPFLEKTFELSVKGIINNTIFTV